MEIPRYAPDLPLPPYSYVPGKFPHPISDPAGHSYGSHPATEPGSDWSSSQRYRLGIDLFNHGYYWEAHEDWEGLWLKRGRTGTAADFLKGLIKLAASGVKAREGNVEGVKRHASRANQLFFEVICHQNKDSFGRLSLDALLKASAAIGTNAGQYLNTSDLPVVRVFPITLSWQADLD